jgi:hypothetical protein
MDSVGSSPALIQLVNKPLRRAGPPSQAGGGVAPQMTHRRLGAVRRQLRQAFFAITKSYSMVDQVVSRLLPSGATPGGWSG